MLPGQKLFSIGALPLFSLDGFQFLTTFVSINGPDSGRFVEGFVDLSGNGMSSIRTTLFTGVS